MDLKESVIDNEVLGLMMSILTGDLDELFDMADVLTR